MLDPREGASGSGVLSRTPLVAIDTSPNRKGHAEPEVELRVPGAPPVRLKAVHPAPPVNPTAAPFWQDALAALPGSDGRGDVQILAGDFNATLDHAELRDLLGRGYVDAADAVGKGFVWTWPAKRRARALPLTIDHVLVDKRVRGREGGRRARPGQRPPGGHRGAALCRRQVGAESRPGCPGLAGKVRHRKPGSEGGESRSPVCSTLSPLKSLEMGVLLSNGPGVERGPTRSRPIG